MTDHIPPVYQPDGYAEGYIHYQTKGSQQWHPLHTRDIQRICGEAEFITVLRTDKLVTDGMTNEELSKIKRCGPLYFDFDNDDDVMGAVGDAKACIQTLGEMMDVEDIHIYLTGGRGLHLEVPQRLFESSGKMVANLHMAYRNLAYSFAEPSLDLTVYSGRKGRMWRVPGRKRDNGMMKVEITYQCLQTIQTAEDYKRLCTQQDAIPPKSGTFSLKLATLFTATSVVAAKPVKKSTTTVTAITPLMRRLFEGEGTGGFHQKALQVGIFANAAGMSLEQTLEQCKALIEKHVSDGYRYNTESKRKRELIRMWHYCEGNPAHALAMGPVRKMLAEPVSMEGESAQAERESTIVFDQLGIHATTDNGQTCLLAARIENFITSQSLETQNMQNVAFDLVPVHTNKPHRLVVPPDTFISSSAINKVLMNYGVAYMGSDHHIKLIYAKLMGSKMSNNERYSTSKEGLQWLQLPLAESELARKGFLVWAANQATVLPRHLEGEVQVVYEGYPDPQGLFKSDINHAPDFANLCATERERVISTLQHWFRSQRGETLAPVLGWMMSTFFKPMIQDAFGKFPILHVAGAAGSSKTETTICASKLFYYREEPYRTSPMATLFAIETALTSTASLPVLIDEYKTHEMREDVHDKMKAMLRNAYNMNKVQRGGGNRSSDSFMALSSFALSAPVVVIAEAIEEETAVLERVVLANFSRPSNAQHQKNFSHYLEFRQNLDVVSSIGLHALLDVIDNWSKERLLAELTQVVEEVRRDHAATPEFLATKPDFKEVQRRQANKERPLFNYAVAKFGLNYLRSILEALEDQDLLNEYDQMAAHLFDRMGDLGQNTLPEWLKLLNAWADMSYMPDNAPLRLRKGYDYDLVRVGDADCVEFNLRACYNKYRSFCGVTRSKALYPGELALTHAFRDIPAVIDSDWQSGKLRMPGGSTLMNREELAASGFRGMRE
jgi:hypothetical protein